MKANLTPEEIKLLKRVEVFLGESTKKELKKKYNKIYSTTEYDRLRTVLRDLRHKHAKLYLFGGLLRDLTSGRAPRDIDLVTNEDSLEHLNPFVQEWGSRYNKFGGLNFRRAGWDFDLWPVEQTWAFRSPAEESGLDNTSFASLPSTTFLNVEAVVVELWPEMDTRRVYENGFFDAFRNRIVEINYEPNPSPAHCVVRSLLVAQRLDFQLGPRLIRYINDHVDTISPRQYEMLQSSHYGRLVLTSGYFDRAIKLIREYCRRNLDRPLAIPAGRQLYMFEGPQIKLNFSEDDVIFRS